MSESDFDFEVIEPGEKYPGSLSMQIPDDLKRSGCNECEDVMKFFIVNKATVFPAEILPKRIKHTQQLHQGIRGMYEIDPLEKFLAVMESRFRGSEGEASNDHWASHNYIIQTTTG